MNDKDTKRNEHVGTRFAGEEMLERIREAAEAALSQWPLASAVLLFVTHFSLEFQELPS